MEELQPIDLDCYLRTLEKGFLTKYLTHHGGNVTRAAASLGIKRTCLIMKLTRYKMVEWLDQRAKNVGRRTQ